MTSYAADGEILTDVLTDEEIEELLEENDGKIIAYVEVSEEFYEKLDAGETEDELSELYEMILGECEIPSTIYWSLSDLEAWDSDDVVLQVELSFDI